MHGDFTPWNLRQLADGTLSLSDWETASWAPPGADLALYRATAAALRNEAVDGSADREACEYWLAMFGETDPDDSDREMRERIVAGLTRLAGD